MLIWIDSDEEEEMERGITAITEQITNQSVIDAVNAKIVQGRQYSEYWNYYMSPEQRIEGFSDNCAAFIAACNVRKRWLQQ